MGLNTSAKLGIIGTVGAVLCALGAVLYIIFPDIVNAKIKQNLRIEAGTPAYKGWEEAPIPIYMQFYLFNVTNPDEFLVNKTKPILQQIGPFTYREYRKKVNITFNDDDTVSYEQLKWFVYEEDKSVGSLNDIVTILNVPLVSLAAKTEGILTSFEKLAINSVIRTYKSTVFIQKTVDELLFGGYYDGLMAYLAKQKKEEILPNNTFGFFYNKNDTADGLYTVYTGVKEPSKFMQIAEWEHNKTLSNWNDTYCDMINGTDGSMFQSFLKKSDTIRLFSTDLCRSVYMNYEEETSVRGIKTYRFAPPFSMMAAADIDPDNKCYCPKDEDCLLSGVLLVSGCRKGAPIVLSSPHFYQGDDRYYNAVVGLNRNKLEHGTILDIEPTTGVVMRASRKLQVNIAFKPREHIKMFKDVPELIFPLLWVNESANWDAERAQQFKDKIFKPQTIGTAVTFALIGVGAFILVCVLLYSIKVFHSKSQAAHIQSSGSELKVTAIRQ